MKILSVSRFLSPPVCSCPVLHDHGLHQNPEAIAAWNRMRVVLFVFVCVCAGRGGSEGTQGNAFDKTKSNIIHC